MSDPTPVVPLRLADVSKHFGAREVLRGVDLEVPTGAFVAIVGSGGSGKTVLLKIAASLLPASEGLVSWFGRSPSPADRHAMVAVRDRIGMQVQNLGLFSFRDVAGNLAFALEKVGMPADQIRARVEPALVELGLAHARDRFPDQISGGMKRRLAIGRVLVKRPALALFDDPAAGLDPLTAERVLRLIATWREQTGAAVLVATPDPGVVTRVADRTLWLREGRLT